MSDPIQASYDNLPYQCVALPQTHPDILRTVAYLYGLDTAPANHCRVLELGCGTGFNIAAMAQYLPGSQFVGIDLSPVQIDMGQALVQAAGLTNVRLEAGSILDIAADFGPFDYIIAHGVYSWVPDEVRTKLRAVCRDSLTPHGVAYVSFNALPGWHLKMLVRDTIIYGGRLGETLEQRVAHGMQYFRDLTGTLAEDTPYRATLRQQLERLPASDPSYIAHEYLEANNQPFHFSKFMADAQADGLQYVQEATPAAGIAMLSPDVIRATMQQAEDLIDLEQRLDFILCRTFRQTLLCRAERELLREGTVVRLETMHFTATAVPTGDTLPDGSMKLRTLGGEERGTPDPLWQKLITELARVWPRSVSYADLLAIANHTDHLPRTLFQGYVAGLVRLHRDKPTLLDIPERPQVPALNRTVIAGGQSAANRYHYSAPLSADGVALAGLCDGRRSVTQLKADVPDQTVAGVSRQQAREQWRRTVEKGLLELRHAALLG